MPICVLRTSVAKVPKDFHLKLSSFISGMLSKPPERISVTIDTNVQMCRGGDSSPNALLQIWSLGVFDKERNPTYTEKLMDYLPQEIGVPKSKLVIVYHPIEKTDLGLWSGD